MSVSFSPMAEISVSLSRLGGEIPRHHPVQCTTLHFRTCWTALMSFGLSGIGKRAIAFLRIAQRERESR